VPDLNAALRAVVHRLCPDHPYHALTPAEVAQLHGRRDNLSSADSAAQPSR
jgi:hypothetical protein